MIKHPQPTEPDVADTTPRAHATCPPADGMSDQSDSGQANLRIRLVVTAALCMVLSAVCWIEDRSLRSLKNRCEVQTTALVQMNADASRISALSSSPKRTTDRRQANEELLSQVEDALHRAGVAPDRWQDSVPQPPKKSPNSPYAELGTRLYLERVSLDEVTAFAHYLVETDLSLRISSLRITAPRRASGASWNVELVVSYLIYG